MKLPFTFGLRLVFRLLLPGFVLSLGLLPAIPALLTSMNLGIPPQYAFAVCVIITGWLFVISEMHLYMFFEGRRYWPWPKCLRKYLFKCEQRRLDELNSLKNELREKDRAKYLEICVELRRFPMDEDGQYYVKSPTRLGNLIEAYEGYPERIYGMDSIFYWHRIWLSIDQPLRDEIDGQQALADSTVYVSGALLSSGFLFMIYAFLNICGILSVEYLPNANILFILSLLTLFSSYALYRASLYLHAQFGETFKSLFDVHGDKISIDKIIDEVATISEDSTLRDQPRKGKYKVAWRYMHNYRIKKRERILTPSQMQHKQAP